jgi:polysaccharide chain length determinant protein (PEP-CTERM system associated)
LIIALAGWAFVWQMPESYVASARVHVDTNSVLRPLMRGLAITPNVNQRITLMSRTLLSRPNMETLARMTDLDLQVTSDADKERLIQRLQSAVRLGAVRGNSSLYNIRVTDPDRDTAKRIAQSLITIFIENSLNDKREDSSDAQTFLEKQIAQSEARLIEAENRLALFKQKNVDVLPGEQGDYYSRLQSLRGELSRAQLQLKELLNRRDELRRQLQGEEPVFIGGSSSVSGSTPLDARIQSMVGQRDQLLARYTDKHPEVRQLNRLIDELMTEREEALAAMPPTEFGGSAAFGGSPVYQGMRTMLAETEAQIAELKVRVTEYQDRVDVLTEKVNAIPEVEAQLKQLNRDYSVLSRQHQEMLERRESARLGGDVESSAGDVSFRVIDPPFVPLKPSEPDKLILNVGVLVFALGGGVAVALLMSLLNPLVSDARVLAYSTGMPLLGSVTFAKSQEQRRRERWRLVGFTACAACLLMAFGGVLVAPEVVDRLL